MSNVVKIDVSMVDDFFKMQAQPIRVRYDIDDNGNYKAFNAETGELMQVGMLAGKLTPEQSRLSIYQNLRDGLPTFALEGEALAKYIALMERPEIAVSAILTPEKDAPEGRLITSFSVTWMQIVQTVTNDWSRIEEISATKWEEIIAEAYKREGFDEVTLTPHSGDYGRDVIAIKRGIGTIKIIGSVKKYKSGLLVKHDDVRALLGVLSGEQDASKGILSTTSGFAPTIPTDPFIKPFLPTRLELIDGPTLKAWLTELANKATS